MPNHPKVPNTINARERIRSAARAWRGATICLSWAHERPGTGLRSGTTIFEEEILVVQVKNCKVKGRRNGEGELTLTLYLEVDTDLTFAYGEIAFLVVEKEDGVATVHFRSIAGINQGPDEIQGPEEIKIERIG